MILSNKRKITASAFILILIFSVNTCYMDARAGLVRSEEIAQQEETAAPEIADFDLRQYVLGKKIEVFLKTRTRVEGEVIRLDDHSILMKASGVWKFTKTESEAQYRKSETVLIPFEDIAHIEIAPKRKWGYGSLAAVGVISILTLSMTLLCTGLIIRSMSE